MGFAWIASTYRKEGFGVRWPRPTPRSPQVLRRAHRQAQAQFLHVVLWRNGGARCCSSPMRRLRWCAVQQRPRLGIDRQLRIPRRSACGLSDTATLFPRRRKGNIRSGQALPAESSDAERLTARVNRARRDRAGIGAHREQKKNFADILGVMRFSERCWCAICKRALRLPRHRRAHHARQEPFSNTNSNIGVIR